MYSYGLLEPGCYYLIQEKKDDSVRLIRVASETDHCLYVFYYDDQLATGWRRKGDSIHDIIECLTDEHVSEWEKQYNDTSTQEQDSYHEDEE
ncbi:hypothetical protein EPD60_14935 [Flaviaesturariibacter flavus]|uniref:Uncharacterized protein n=1 Tax=Flaviaesturariibacter flavus TaxID=2502780 RepID=A0A4R1B8M6_9BACT|nr:hypothetical protein [Flaviaesturariibacter flavus]TCJ12563.1 hypothetical protein EPD60_14935 [Flaviaesturariibacter flavus]